MLAVIWAHGCSTHNSFHNMGSVTHVWFLTSTKCWQWGTPIPCVSPWVNQHSHWYHGKKLEFFLDHGKYLILRLIQRSLRSNLTFPGLRSPLLYYDDGTMELLRVSSQYIQRLSHAHKLKNYSCVGPWLWSTMYSHKRLWHDILTD